MNVMEPPAVDYQNTSVRPGWGQLPVGVREEICGRLGPVVSVTVAGSGFTPAFAATLTNMDGQRFFVKAADAVTEFGRANRREAAVLAALPAGLPVPHLCWVAVVDGWAVLCLSVIDGHLPGQPWTAADMDAALAAQAMIADRKSVV